jgi:DSF synthase
MWPELGQLETACDISHGTLWTFIDFGEQRPSYNPALLEDFHRWQANIVKLKAELGNNLRYLVLGSRHPRVFCLGGDLDHFAACIQAGDRDALLAYGRSCITILHRNWNALGTDLITIGLAQGDALGGGLESLLSFDVICAERGTRFGFPEQLFGLFPGMGALTFLGRKLGFAKAEQLIRTGRCFSAEEMHEMGLIHILAEPSEGIAAVKRYIDRGGRRHAAQHAFHAAAKRANPVPFEELDAVVSLWADACMTLSPHDLAVMRRLVAAQSRLPAVDERTAVAA